ncbi:MULTISPECIES: Arc family DNA-binding protein [Asaia]|uniref:Arc family DNA-binding protein n=1 Tax=Asaia TaxID=91914 RepID=UPI002FC2A355
MKHTDPQVKIRLPEELHRHLKMSARHEERTMSGHIVFLLRQDMEKEKGTGAEFGHLPDASNQ